CQACGVSVDRDLNASLNLLHYAEGFSVKSLSDRVLPTVRGDAAQSPISAVSVEKELCKTGTKH
ncbi:transposase, partial [Limnoraphis robusta CCNP1324]|nr:transposase [Limnoraphis robusta CCNP1324]